MLSVSEASLSTIVMLNEVKHLRFFAALRMTGKERHADRNPLSC
jgi:hypothetical protein